MQNNGKLQTIFEKKQKLKERESSLKDLKKVKDIDLGGEYRSQSKYRNDSAHQTRKKNKEFSNEFELSKKHRGSKDKKVKVMEPLIIRDTSAPESLVGLQNTLKRGQRTEPIDMLRKSDSDHRHSAMLIKDPQFIKAR
jgi:hypothetical protein